MSTAQNDQKLKVDQLLKAAMECIIELDSAKNNLQPADRARVEQIVERGHNACAAMGYPYVANDAPIVCEATVYPYTDDEAPQDTEPQQPGVKLYADIFRNFLSLK